MSPLSPPPFSYLQKDLRGKAEWGEQSLHLSFLKFPVCHVIVSCHWKLGCFSFKQTKFLYFGRLDPLPLTHPFCRCSKCLWSVHLGGLVTFWHLVPLDLFASQLFFRLYRSPLPLVIAQPGASCNCLYLNPKLALCLCYEFIWLFSHGSIKIFPQSPLFLLKWKLSLKCWFRSQIIAKIFIRWTAYFILRHDSKFLFRLFHS